MTEVGILSSGYTISKQEQNKKREKDIQRYRIPYTQLSLTGSTGSVFMFLPSPSSVSDLYFQTFHRISQKTGHLYRVHLMSFVMVS